MPSPLERPLAVRHRAPSLRTLGVRAGAATLVLAALVLLLSRVDVKHDLHRMHVRVLSGSPEGHYHALVEQLGALAAERRGVVEEVPTAGSPENVRQLAMTRRSCRVQFGLVQDGTPWEAGLVLVARLPKREALLLLGRDAANVDALAQLRGARIGAGPAGSGTDAVVRALFALPDLQPLGVTLSNHELGAELEMAANGSLDLAAMVIDPDAPLVDEWVGKRGLQLASLDHAESVARRLPHLKAGVVAAGHYDAVRVVPRADRKVLEVETLLVGNDCASRVETLDLLEVLAMRYPGLVRHNRDTPNTTGLALAHAAADYFANGGPELADQYVPWLVDVMPPANWAYVVMGVSLLFNAMGFGHRFRLWRIDAARVKLESELARLFPPSTTLGDIRRTRPEGALATGPVRAEIDRVVGELEALAQRSRRYSLSVLVPMGQEMAYRYQESVIYETLAVLREFRGQMP